MFTNSFIQFAGFQNRPDMHRDFQIYFAGNLREFRTQISMALPSQMPRMVNGMQPQQSIKLADRALCRTPETNQRTTTQSVLNSVCNFKIRCSRPSAKSLYFQKPGNLLCVRHLCYFCIFTIGPVHLLFAALVLNKEVFGP